MNITYDGEIITVVYPDGDKDVKHVFLKRDFTREKLESAFDPRFVSYLIDTVQSMDRRRRKRSLSLIVGGRQG